MYCCDDDVDDIEMTLIISVVYSILYIVYKRICPLWAISVPRLQITSRCFFNKFTNIKVFLMIWLLYTSVIYTCVWVPNWKVFSTKNNKIELEMFFFIFFSHQQKSYTCILIRKKFVAYRKFGRALLYTRFCLFFFIYGRANKKMVLKCNLRLNQMDVHFCTFVL